MPGPDTDKYGLPTLAGTDLINAYPAVFNEAIETLDDTIAAIITTMPRPAAGKVGRFHMAPDGTVSFDTGAAWVTLVPDTAVQGLSFVGQLAFDAGSGDLAFANQEWLQADGRLIDRTTYATYFARAGHAHNGGVDPGSNQVRIPDYRGRTHVGPDNMGTVRGAANLIPNSNRARGQNGGAERHTLASAESGVAAHGHADTINFATGGGGAHSHVKSSEGGDFAVGNTGSPFALPYGSGSGPALKLDGATATTGSDHNHPMTKSGAVTNHAGAAAASPHNNMQPYAVDSVLVRVK